MAKAAISRKKAFAYPHPADDLSFMKPRRNGRGGGIDYWLVNPTGDYSEECEIGKKLADEYLTYIGKHPTNFNATLLTCIVRDMIDRAKDGQKWSGVHVGFLSTVNSCAMAGAQMVVRVRTAAVETRKAARAAAEIKKAA